MPTPMVPQGTRIYIESSRGAAQTVSSLTKADPPVLTYAGTDPANGDYMILRNILGMTELEDAVVKVANVNTVSNTYELKDQDSTAYGTFVSGSMYPVAFATELTIATGFTPNGGEPQYATYMYLWDRQERRKYTHNSAAGIDIPVIFDPTDANYQTLYNLARTGGDLAVKFLFPNGVEWLTIGSFGGSGMPSAGDSRSVMTAQFSVNPSNKPFYVLP